MLLLGDRFGKKVNAKYLQYDIVYYDSRKCSF